MPACACLCLPTFFLVGRRQTGRRQTGQESYLSAFGTGRPLLSV